MSLRQISPRPLELQSQVEPSRPSFYGHLARFKLRWSIYGSGTRKLLLLSSGTSPCSDWSHQIDYFSTDSRYSILLVDLRANHSTFKLPLTTKQMARIIINLLSELNWQQDLHVCGHSLGGCVALQISILVPAWIASLTVVSTFARCHLPPITNCAAKCAAVVRSLAGNVEHWAGTELQTLYPAAHSAELVPHNLVRNIARCQQECQTRDSPSQIVARVLHHVTDAQLDKIRTSIHHRLVICGDMDEVVSPLASCHLSELLDCKMILLDGAGHSPITESPDVFFPKFKQVYR